MKPDPLICRVLAGYLILLHQMRRKLTEKLDERFWFHFFYTFVLTICCHAHLSISVDEIKWLLYSIQFISHRFFRKLFSISFPAWRYLIIYTNQLLMNRKSFKNLKSVQNISSMIATSSWLLFAKHHIPIKNKECINYQVGREYTHAPLFHFYNEFLGF